MKGFFIYIFYNQSNGSDEYSINNDYFIVLCFK